MKYLFNIDFIYRILIPEFKILCGKNYYNLLLLTVLFLISIITIGVADKSIGYLDKRMNDPYANKLTIEIPYAQNSIKGFICNFKEKLNRDSIMMKFNYSKVESFNRFPQFLIYKDNCDKMIAIGRTINYDSNLLNTIVDTNRYRKFVDNESYGVVVTKTILEKLNYSEGDNYIKFSNYSRDVNNSIPIPIIAITEKLPNKCDFLCTPNFYYYLKYSPKNPFNVNNYINTLKIVTYDEVEADSVFNITNRYFKLNHKELELYINLPCKDTLSYKNGISVLIEFDESINCINKINKIFNDLCMYSENIGIKLERSYDFEDNLNHYEDNYSVDFLSVDMNTLQYVKKFNDFIEKDKISVDMSVIKEKENYNIISILTKLMIYVLIVMCFLLTSSFISQIYRRHMYIIKQNLGIFKAIGIHNRRLYVLYCVIFILLLFFSLFISNILILILNKFGIIKQLTSLSYYTNFIDVINTFSCYVFILYLIVIITSILTILKISYKILKKTPGDLIYNR